LRLQLRFKFEAIAVARPCAHEGIEVVLIRKPRVDSRKTRIARKVFGNRAALRRELTGENRVGYERPKGQPRDVL
jgi:hypothetical protein